LLEAEDGLIESARIAEGVAELMESVGGAGVELDALE
jgi:hypothetical protein